MQLRKLNLHFTFTEVPHEISKLERRLHCRNLFFLVKKDVLSNFARSHISSDRVRSGYEISPIMHDIHLAF